MAHPPPAHVKLPPQSVARCWLVFWVWVLGVPVVVVAAFGAIWLAFWALGSMPMDGRASMDLLSTLWWLGVVVLLYPAMLWIWWGDLRDGIKAARDWEAMTPGARDVAIAQAEAVAVTPKRRSRGKK